MLHEGLLVPVLIYGSKRVVSRKKKTSKIKVMNIDNLRDLLGMKKINKIPISLVKKMRRRKRDGRKDKCSSTVW